jgi:hypothetical protein
MAIDLLVPGGMFLLPRFKVEGDDDVMNRRFLFDVLRKGGRGTSRCIREPFEATYEFPSSVLKLT